MNTLVAVAEFLPTDNTEFVPYTVLAGLIALGCGIIFLTVGLVVRRKSAIIALACSIVAIFSFVSIATIANYSANQENQYNLKSNIMSVYNLDNVAIHQWDVNSVNSDKLTKITVTRDEMDADVYLSQDTETYEPTLTPGPSTDDVAEWLSKK